MPGIKQFCRNNWPILCILLLALGALVYKIDKPFWGHHDWNGVYWGNVARNYVRYGLETKLAMVENVGVVPPAEFSYTFHYSPLYPMTEGIIFGIFGVREWAARGLSVMFSLGTLTVFYLLVKKFYSVRVALAAILFWVVTPMFLYFGKMPVHEPMVLFLSVATIYAYLGKKLRLTILFVVLAELTTWPGYFVVPAITAHWWFTRKKNNWSAKQILILWLGSFLVFVSLLIHDLVVTGSPLGGGLKEIFLERVAEVAIIPYLTILLRWSWTYYGLLLPLAVLAIVLVLRRKLAKFEIILLLFVFAVIYPVVFRDASFRHDYLLIYFLPFLSLGGAAALNVLIKHKTVFIVAVIIIAVTSLVTRWKFIFALNNSDIYRESVRLGKYINEHSLPTEVIGVQINDRTIGFDGWFINYYADRKLTVVNGRTLEGKYDRTFYYQPGGLVVEGEMN